MTHSNTKTKMACHVKLRDFVMRLKINSSKELSVKLGNNELGFNKRLVTTNEFLSPK